MRKHVAGAMKALAIVGVGAAALSPSAQGQVITSEHAAGIISFPRVISDPNDLFNVGSTPTR